MTAWLTPRRAALLRRVCREATLRDGVVVNEESLRRALCGTDEVFSELRGEAQQKVRTRFSAELMFVEFGAALLADLVVTCSDRHKKRRRIMWATVRDPPRQSQSATLLQAVLTNLANSALATCSLLSAGYEQQALPVLRSFVEVSALAVAILGDLKTYRAFIATPMEFDQAAKHWRTHLTHERLLGVLQPLYPFLADKKGARSFFADRRRRYQFLSSRTHVHPAGLLLGAHFSRRGRFSVALGGGTGHGTKVAFDDLGLFLFDVVSMVVALLRDKHHWKFQEDFLASWTVFKRMYVMRLLPEVK